MFHRIALLLAWYDARPWWLQVAISALCILPLASFLFALSRRRTHEGVPAPLCPYCGSASLRLSLTWGALTCESCDAHAFVTVAGVRWHPRRRAS